MQSKHNQGLLGRNANSGVCLRMLAPQIEVAFATVIVQIRTTALRKYSITTTVGLECEFLILGNLQERDN